jgi:hypothetical protein
MKRIWALVALTVLVLAPSSSQLHADARDAQASASRAETRQIQEKDDPYGDTACSSMGRLDITYETGDMGPPGVGLRVTDPRGRTIGYDFRINKGWQEMPLAQASLECDQNEDTGELRNCKGDVEICGPIRGAYQLHVLPTRNGKYSIAASATSQAKTDESGHEMTSSHVELKGEIRERKPVLLTLQYSREAGSRIKLSRSDEHIADRVRDEAQGASH